MSSSAPEPDEPQGSRLTLASEAMLRAEVERAARRRYCDLDGVEQKQAVEYMVAFFSGERPPGTLDSPPRGATLCDLCVETEPSRLFVAVSIGQRPGVEPKLELGKDPRIHHPFALCRPCATRDWIDWEAGVERIVGDLQRGSPVAKDAALDLASRFRDRRIRVTYDACSECDYCHRSASCVQGYERTICLRCLHAANGVFEREEPAVQARLAEERRLRVEGRTRPFPDEMRSWFTKSASYSAMGHYRNQTRGLTPPVDLVDRVCTHLAAMLESEALNGYRRRDKAQFTDDVSVVSDRWIAHAIGPFLWEGRMSPAVRERCDVALVLLRHALATGASYMEYNERLYTFEQDIRPELSRRGSGGR